MNAVAQGLLVFAIAAFAIWLGLHLLDNRIP